MEDYQDDGAGYSMTLTYPRDISGQRTGTYDQRPKVNWSGWDVYWSQVAGQRLNMGGASAYIDHSDATGSTTMETDPAGSVQWDIVHYPWGQIWQQGGTRQSEVAMGLDWQVNDVLIPSASREYNFRVYRWMTPDPGGRKVVKLDNPQTWNMYAYVGNNPTSRNDPSGLCTVDGEKHNWLWCAGHVFGLTETKKEFSARIEVERSWLIRNVSRNTTEASALRGASPAQVQRLYKQWDAALFGTQCGGLWGCETWYPASELKRAESGSFVPLTKLHSDTTITETNGVSYEFWKNKTTGEIIKSLRPGSGSEPLIVKPNGTVMNGNTRIKVLEERGVDVNNLERIILEGAEEIP